MCTNERRWRQKNKMYVTAGIERCRAIRGEFGLRYLDVAGLYGCKPTIFSNDFLRMPFDQFGKCYSEAVGFCTIYRNS